MNRLISSFTDFAPTPRVHPGLADEMRHYLSVDDLSAIDIRQVVVGRRIVPLSHASHVRGWHPVGPLHAPIPFESKLEATVISTFAVLGELRRIESQPVTVSYRWQGTTYRYTPDLRVQLAVVPSWLRRLGVGPDTFIEVKPLRRAQREQMALHRRFSAIRAALNRPIVLVTDVDLPQMLWEVSHGR
jgi:hypothetical protein